MLGKLRIEKPPPSPVVDFAGAIDDMAELMVKSMHQQHHVFVATDGSADKDVSALADVLPECDGEVATGVPSEDPGAFRAEVEAIHAAVFSAILACRRCRQLGRGPSAGSACACCNPYASCSHEG